jgi:hypothetical protein
MSRKEKPPAGCKLIGRWRIIEADIFDREHLDLANPPRLIIGAGGHGEIAFGALEAGLDLEYANDSVWFEWDGCDEGDPVAGQGSAHLEDDGSLEIAFEWRHSSDEAVLKAVFFNSLLAIILRRGLSNRLWR